MPKDDLDSYAVAAEPIDVAPRRFDARRTRKSVFEALLRARREAGGRRVAIIDGDGRTLSYTDLARAALALGRPIAKRTKRRDAVALLLPTGAPAAVAFFALSAYGRVPAMLNFTAGARALKAALRVGGVKKVITARRFIEAANLGDIEAALAEDAEILYLEDLRANLTLADKALAGARAALPALAPRSGRAKDLGVILFTSGTEGDPKGVALSHENLVANVEQIRQHIEIFKTDLLFNPLPTFHCFGLTVGLLTPLFAGVPAALHPTPLQSKTIAKRIAETRATFLIATDTFLAQYARAAGDKDLSTLRLAVCGAERVRDETRALIRRKFDLEVLEGYGATEAAPVIAANQAGAGNHPGSVGRLLPGIEARIVAEPGIPGAGRLYVRGPNVMKGYLRPDGTRRIDPLPDGWHDTGDIVSLDESSVVTIRGRLKRFAKVGGEMVSLAVVENCASTLWPENTHAAVAARDPRKGETIVLVTDYKHAERADLLAFAQNHGVPELAVPRRIKLVREIPVLGTGKIDYPGVSRMLAQDADDEAA